MYSYFLVIKLHLKQVSNVCSSTVRTSKYTLKCSNGNLPLPLELLLLLEEEEDLDEEHEEDVVVVLADDVDEMDDDLLLLRFRFLLSFP